MAGNIWQALPEVPKKRTALPPSITPLPSVSARRNALATSAGSAMHAASDAASHRNAMVVCGAGGRAAGGDGRERREGDAS